MQKMLKQIYSATVTERFLVLLVNCYSYLSLL